MNVTAAFWSSAYWSAASTKSSTGSSSALLQRGQAAICGGYNSPRHCRLCMLRGCIAVIGDQGLHPAIAQAVQCLLGSGGYRPRGLPHPVGPRPHAAISYGWRSPQREDRFRTRGMIGNVLCCETLAWNQFIGITMLLFALTNPVGAIPIFLAMTRQAGSVKTHRIIILASAAVAIFVVGSIVLGTEILSFFNVGLDDFRIAGELLALVIAFEMFQTQHGKLLQLAASGNEVDIHGLAITPFAFPLLVGPAEMSIMITLSNDNRGWLR